MGVRSVLLGLAFVHCKGFSFNFDNEYLPRSDGMYSAMVSGATENLTAAQWAAINATTAQPTVFPNLPAGCTCVNDQQSAVTCSAFVCHQTCNLVVGKCDAFCCSDPDCSAADVARFKSMGKCLPDGSERDTVKFCADVSTLDKVTAKFNMYVETDDNALDGLLCVSVSNNPFEGEFYAPQNNLLGNVAVLDSMEVTVRGFSNNDDAIPSSARIYVSGAPVLTASASSADSNGSPQGIFSAFGGFLPLSTAGTGGLCTTNNFVSFLQDVQVNECVQSFADLQTACSAGPYGPLSTQQFVSGNMLAGVSPSSSIAENSAWVQIKVGQVLQQNPVTGAISPYTGPQTSSPSRAPTASPTLSPPTVSPATAAPSASAVTPAPVAPPVPTFNTFWDSGNCYNALRGVSYTIQYNMSGVITGVTVDLTVSTLTNSTMNSEPGSLSGITQFSKVQFVNVDSVAPDSAYVPRLVSGNPGYIQGLAVQAGIAVSAQDAGKSGVVLAPAGLQMMSAAGSQGSCLPGASAGPFWQQMNQAGLAPSTTPVLFGIDAASACTLDISFDEFANNLTTWCTDWSSSNLFYLPVGSVVGIYGNADPLKSYDWLPLELQKQGIPTKPSSVSGSYACENVVDGVDIEILWTKSGSTSDPQSQILAARAVLHQSTWAWRRAPVSGSSQKFSLSYSVTFVEKKLDTSQKSNYKPMASSVLPLLSYDIFYPFDIVVADSGASHSSPLSLLAVGLLALGMFA